MLDDQGFDLWADGYDKSVGVSDEEHTYPFAGYKRILGSIYQTVMEKQHPTVLDLGFGTGTLTAKLYENGCEIYGQDFSSRMIELASAKMPKAHLYRGDLTKGLAEPLKRHSYDFIVATYSIHHLKDDQKIVFLKELLKHLNGDGRILIGDVAFETRAELDRCKEESPDEWDDDEFYCVADELKTAFPGLVFRKMTFCAGILTLSAPKRPDLPR
jgi:putative AdoMet-dependent methyltransferase